MWGLPQGNDDHQFQHRSYEEREPIELRVSHDELVFVSFPGPDRSIRMEDLKVGRAVSRRYRNRRIGEFF